MLHRHTCVGLLLCCLLGSQSVADDETQQKARLAELKKTIATLQQELQGKDRQKSALVSELRKVELEAGKISGQIRKVEADISQINHELKELETQQNSLRQSIAAQSDAIAAELTSAYKLGAQEPVKLLLNQEDPQRMARIFKYYNYFVQARRAKIDAYQADVTALARVVEASNRQKLALTRSQQELQEQHENLLARNQERSETLQKLNAELRNEQDRLRKLNTERDELQALIDAVEQAIANIAMPDDYRPFTQTKGKLSWPLKGKVRNAFGSPRSGSLRWEGWMVAASSGAPVQAVHHGRVVFAEYLRGFGLLIIIDHGEDYMTLYAHNQELLKDTGDWVRAGETIARAGNTGGLDAPALYFEIRRKGKPADPKVWLARR